MKITVLIGRILYSIMFIQAIGFHFSKPAVDYATAAGVPFASILVPLSGVLAFVGALSVALGLKAKWGAWCIILFLIPVTFFMHAFWKESDPTQAQIQYAMFFKNLSMLGAAFMITYFGSGPLSLDRNEEEEHDREIKREINKLVKAN